MVFLVTLSFCLSQCRPECLRNCHSSRTDDNPLFVASNSQNVPWMATRSQWRAELQARGKGGGGTIIDPEATTRRRSLTMEDQK